MKLRVKGAWPGKVALHKGLSRADSRPWNDDVPLAQLRVHRGGAAFVEACAATLHGLGAGGVLSPPLPESAQKVWRAARFEPHAHLDLLRRDLHHIGSPGHLVATGALADLDEALRIDTAAFDPFWRFDMPAMVEALRATSHSVIHVVRSPGSFGLAGFAITGMGSRLAYLQRVAVDPSHQGSGIGRSLVRTACLWARRNGAEAIVLNTQSGNEPALGLYATEGFQVLEDPLAVLRK